MTTALSTEDLALARGSLTNRGADTFAWDYEERMTSATVAGTTTTFAYRGDGLRHSRTTGANTTTFTWDIAAGLPVVIDDGSQYVYGAGLEAMLAGTSTYYYLADGLGSTMAIVGSTGTVQKSYTYDVYGKPTATGSLPNEFDFAAQQTDPTGLQYLRARYLDPETGTFLSREPASLSPGWLGNHFSYGAANPARLADPTGLRPVDSNGCDLGDETCAARDQPRAGQFYWVDPNSGGHFDYDWQFLGNLQPGTQGWQWLAWAYTDSGDVLFGECSYIGEYRHCSPLAGGGGFPFTISDAALRQLHTLFRLMDACAADTICSIAVTDTLLTASALATAHGNAPLAAGLYTAATAWSNYSTARQPVGDPPETCYENCPA